MFVFEILHLLRETLRLCSVEYSHSELYGLFVVTGTTLSVISCIAFVDSSRNLFFFSSIFLSTKLGIPQKI